MSEMIRTHVKAPQHRNLAAGRYRQDFRCRKAEVARVRGIGRTDEDGLRISFPQGAVNCRTRVGSEPGCVQRARTEAQFAKSRHGWRRIALAEPNAREYTNNYRRQSRACKQREAMPPGSGCDIRSSELQAMRSGCVQC